MTKIAQVDTTFAEKARKLIPKLRERAAETENIRRIPEVTMNELKENGWTLATLQFELRLDTVMK